MNWTKKLSDGAMGTMLFEAGLRPGECGGRWNLDRPDDVASIHRRYLDAGCEIMTANSFGSTPRSLARYGLQNQTAAINAAAVRIAREASAGKAWVAGDVGSLGEFLEPYGDLTAEAAQGEYEAQIHALAEAGVDTIFVETMADPREAAIAVACARRAFAGPVFCTFAFQPSPGGFRTLMGAAPGAAVAAAIDAGTDGVGANCGTSMSLADYLELTRELKAAAAGRPVLVQPNAGAPRADGSYSATPAELAAWAKEAIALGAATVGGCCGTKPDHLRAMEEAIRDSA